MQLLGARSLPEVGEDLLVVDSERVARYVAQQRAQAQRQLSAGEQISRQQEEVEKQKKQVRTRIYTLTHMHIMFEHAHPHAMSLSSVHSSSGPARPARGSRDAEQTGVLSCTI